MDSSELRKRHCTFLKEKYQIGQSKSAASDSFLYLILRKADLGIQVTDLELRWLAKNHLVKAIEIISLQQYRAEEKERLEAEVLQLQIKYRIPKNSEIPISSSIHSVLWKLDSGHKLTDSELELLNVHGFKETLDLIQDVLYFLKLKIQYKASQHSSQIPEDPLHSILKKLDAKEQLFDSEAEWLLGSGFEETLEIYWQQEEVKKAELEFLQLKSKYQVHSDSDISISNPLYAILKKIDTDQELEPNECEWLEQKKLSGLIKIDRKLKDKKSFVKLKDKYKAAQYPDSDPCSPLFKILEKLELSQLKLSYLHSNLETLLDHSEFQISEEDIQWLAAAELTETVQIAQKCHFRVLKFKYQIVDPQLSIDLFYGIMLKLERQERLDPKQVVQLIVEGRLSPYGKIAIAHYKLEAIFYEKEYQRTGNRRNLASASSNWRKADESKKALKVTENVNWSKVQEPDLKSALLVTRGAAFRDLGQLDEAENCAAQAMECQPNTHQPYTLMGAICYDRGKYAEGNNWFEMAAERGADDADDEIERIVRMTKDKDKRREVAEYLLGKDPKRYAWAKSCLKQEKL